MRNMLKIIKERLMEEPLVLVTVTASSGATPRGAGARMLVGRRGRISGTIGGGAVEYRSEQIALEVLQSGQSKGHEFSLTRGDIQNLGMICGGECNVYFHYIPAGDPDTIALTEKAEKYFFQNEDFWLISDLGAGGKLSLAKKGDAVYGEYLARRPCRIQAEGRNLYIEQVNQAGMVYVFGGGHLAQELVPLLSHVGFRCVVMDDREEFAREALFPTAEKVILGDFSAIKDLITVGTEDYVCIMTRGHASDTLIQAQVLRCHPCYCGVIGSRSKAAAVRTALKEQYGLSEEEMDQVTTPIGLPIKAETPAEIAVSIAAQMILIRAERTGK